MSDIPTHENANKNRTWSGWLVIGLISLLVLPFQNCGKGYVAKDYSSIKQCQTKAKAVAQQNKVSGTQLRCSDFNSYLCEQRIFSPDVEDMIHLQSECVPGTEICVDLEVRQFNTSSAKSGASAEQFLPGGDYNREEIRCFHRYTVQGFAVFEGEGDSLGAALAKAMAACEAGSGQ